MPQRRALISFARRLDGELMLSHRLVGFSWPLQTTSLVTWMDSQTEGDIVILSITWLEPAPGLWARIKAWLLT